MAALKASAMLRACGIDALVLDAADADLSLLEVTLPATFETTTLRK